MTSPYDTYTSPLATRNASPEMLRLWSARHKFNTWRRIWLAVAEAMCEMGEGAPRASSGTRAEGASPRAGLPPTRPLVTREQVEELRAVVNRKNPDGTTGITDDEIRLAERYERELRHDVMAHVHALGDACPKARPIIHLGMTSQDVVCNADLLILSHGLKQIVLKCARVLLALGVQSERLKEIPCLGFTHFQPAQPTTVGRRVANWTHELWLSFCRVDQTLRNFRLRGLTGATGTQASFLAILSEMPRPSRESHVKKCLFRALDSWDYLPRLTDPDWRDLSDGIVSAAIEASAAESINDFRSIPPDELAGLPALAGYERGVAIRAIREFQEDLQYVGTPGRRYFAKPGKAVDSLDEHAMSLLIFSDDWAWGQRERLTITAQTYPRVIDTFILADLASVAAVLHKIATDIRLLSNRKELDEPFEDKQIGSSAMPYKRNPMRCERICGLTRFVMNLVGNAYDTAATQWLERTLDDSSNRRLSLPEAFLALDGALDLMHNVASGLIVHEAMVRKNLMAELPFMATENILMACVRAGGDRQHYHELIRVHAQAAGLRVKQEGLDNDLLDRLKADRAFWSTARGGPLAHELDWSEGPGGLLDPMRYIGRSVEQTERFIRDIVEPLREQYKGAIEGLGQSGPRV